MSLDKSSAPRGHIMRVKKLNKCKRAINADSNDRRCLMRFLSCSLIVNIELREKKTPQSSAMKYDQMNKIKTRHDFKKGGTDVEEQKFIERIATDIYEYTIINRA